MRRRAVISEKRISIFVYSEQQSFVSEKDGQEYKHFYNETTGNEDDGFRLVSKVHNDTRTTGTE